MVHHVLMFSAPLQQNIYLRHWCVCVWGGGGGGLRGLHVIMHVLANGLIVSSSLQIAPENLEKVGIHDYVSVKHAC